MLDRRVHILLDADRYRRLVAEAAARGTSVAAIVRDAIDRALPGDPAAAPPPLDGSSTLRTRPYPTSKT